MKCNEVTSLSSNQSLGLHLTWDEANTGIPTQVVLRAYQGSGFVCEDNELWGGAAGWLSVGDVDNYENDDFAVEVNPPSGVDVFAIGLTVGDSAFETGEKLSVFDEGDILLREFTSGLPNTGNGNKVFMGIVSGIPLYRIHYDEHAGGDDIGVRDVRLGLVQW